MLFLNQLNEKYFLQEQFKIYTTYMQKLFSRLQYKSKLLFLSATLLLLGKIHHTIVLEDFEANQPRFCTHKNDI